MSQDPARKIGRPSDEGFENEIKVLSNAWSLSCDLSLSSLLPFLLPSAALYSFLFLVY